MPIGRTYRTASPKRGTTVSTTHLSEQATPSQASERRSLLFPLACIAAVMGVIVSLLAPRIVPGAPHGVTLAIGVIGPFLGAGVARTIGVTLRWLVA